MNKNDFETSCGENLSGFTSTKISCVVTNGGRTLRIRDGFLNLGTNTLSDSDGLYYPPDLEFTLDKF